MKKMLIIVLPILVIITFGVVRIVEAACYGKTVTGSVAGIPTTSYKSHCFGENTWNPYMSSRADSNVDTIGYTWWTVQKVCNNGHYEVWVQRTNGHYNNARVYSAQDLYTYCPEPE